MHTIHKFTERRTRILARTSIPLAVPVPTASPHPHAHGGSGANIIGYVRCKKDAGSRITNGLQGMASRAGMNNMVGQALQSAAGRAFGL